MVRGELVEEEGFRDRTRVSVSLPTGLTHIWEFIVKTGTLEEHSGLLQ
jgi:hypothetical protein